MTKNESSLKNAHIVPRSEHHISRNDITPNALKVLYRLKKCGYDAYLVGGCVRDLLLHHKPKDFDIATNARPDEVNRIFKNCRLIGRRFRLAHIYYPKEIIEVATFRGSHEGADTDIAHSSDQGIIMRDNVYGNIEEDAWRRDFTINALYYNIKDFSIVDFTSGVKDLKNKKLKIMGDATKRYKEDPVRMMRAMRFAAKLDMKIEPKTAEPIKKLAKQLEHISPSRLFDETVKLFHSGYAKKVFLLMREHHLFRTLFPQTHKVLSSKRGEHFHDMLVKGFDDTDQRIKAEKGVSCGYLLAFLLWPVIEKRAHSLKGADGIPPLDALHEHSQDVTKTQGQITSIPRRFSGQIHDIWILQYRLLRTRRRSIMSCLNHKRFRAAYDLLLLRSKADKTLKPVATWWTDFQTASKNQREEMIKTKPGL